MRISMINSRKGFCFILNGKSGSCDPASVSEIITRIAADRGIHSTIKVWDNSSNIADLVKIALEGGADVIVAGGGDGTINAVASELVGSSAALGVLPLGTLNHFAKDLFIPLSIEDAVETVFSGESIRVDVGEVNGRIFLNNSGIGLYPNIVLHREAFQKQGRKKAIALLLAIAKKIATYRLIKVTLTVEGGRQVARTTPFIFVGNNAYEMSGFRIGSRSNLDGGRLWVCLAPEAGRFKLLISGVRAVLGLQKASDLEVVETTNLEIKTHRRLRHVAMDGEVANLKAPLNYRSLQKALFVIVPARDVLVADYIT